MTELAFTSLAVLVGLLRLQLRVRGRPSGESGVLVASFVAHVASTVALVELTTRYYEAGDMFMYVAVGGAVAQQIASDPAFYLVEALRLFFHQEPDFAFTIVGAGSGTGSLVALTGLILWVAQGSVYATSLLFSLAAWEGQVSMYDGLRRGLPTSLAPRIALGVMLVPSVVFWTSGVVKESPALFGLGLMTHAMTCFPDRWARGVTIGTLGALLAGAIKGYLLFAFVLASAVLVVAARRGRSPRRRRPLPFALRLSLAVAGTAAALALLGWLVPRFALENVVSEADRLRASAARIEAGSNFELVDAEEGPAPTAVLVPIALATTLFRPFPWEATNPLALLSAAETLAISLLLLAVLAKRPITRTWAALRARPILLFSVVFSVLLAISVGMSTGNLGTLSRYRIPMMPFWVMSLLVLHSARAIEPARLPKPMHSPLSAGAR